MSDEQRKQFEDQARGVARKTLPPEWRAEILEAALHGGEERPATWENVVEIVKPEAGGNPEAWEKRIRRAERRTVWSIAACFVMALLVVALVFRPKPIASGMPDAAYRESGRDFRADDWREGGTWRTGGPRTADPSVVTSPVARSSLPSGEGFPGGVAVSGAEGTSGEASSRERDALGRILATSRNASSHFPDGIGGGVHRDRNSLQIQLNASDDALRPLPVPSRDVPKPAKAGGGSSKGDVSVAGSVFAGGDSGEGPLPPKDSRANVVADGDQRAVRWKRIFDGANPSAGGDKKDQPAPKQAQRKKRPFVFRKQVSNNVTEEVRYTIDQKSPDGEYQREVGVTVAVTPKLLPDGTIRMKMRPRSASVADEVIGQSGNRYREVSESMIEKVASIPPGHSLVVGGFYGQAKKKDGNKVPSLGDIPRIGMFFKSEETVEEDPSLLFVVTPSSTGNRPDGNNRVVIEAKVLRVNDSVAGRVGVDWQASLGAGGMPAEEIGKLNSLIGLVDSEPGGGMMDGAVVLSPEQTRGVLKALEEGDLVRQVSNPTLVTEEDELATISLIDRVPIVTTTRNEDELPAPEPEPLPEEPEQDAREEPWSTFSLNVSDVSFKLAQAALARGEWPASGQMRVEEFVNAFDYRDRSPSQNEKVACHLEQAAHPFMQQRNLLRVSMKTAALGRAATTPLRLTVLLDNSGSMERSDRVESVKRAFQLLASQLNAEDQITLIGFARTPRLLADRLSGSRVAELADIVDSTPSRGGTNIEEALKLGLEKAKEQMVNGAQNRIILLTDGAVNLGNARPDDLAMLVERMRGSGIAFDACGVGADGYNDEVLEVLTRKGDGRYYFLDRPEDADEGFAKQIAGALRPAARNVKVQVEFNPERVGRYKLYGFHKHRLNKEDFRDDSVDAAELAEAEAGNAVYQFEVLPQGSGDIGTVSVRFQDAGNGTMVERRWTIPHVARIPRLESSGPSLRLAAAAALLGEKLRGTAIGESVEMDRLGRLVDGLQGAFPADRRVAALRQMVRTVRELGGE